MQNSWITSGRSGENIERDQCVYNRELFQLRHKKIMYKRGPCHGQTKGSGTYLKNRVRKSKVQKDFVKNANNYRSPEGCLWSKVKNKKERFNFRENNIMSRNVREKAKLSIFFSAFMFCIKD